MRRLLFVRRSRYPRKASSYLALAALAALALAGLSVASRPQEPPVGASKSADPGPPAGRASDRVPQIPLPAPTPGTRSRWM